MTLPFVYPGKSLLLVGLIRSALAGFMIPGSTDSPGTLPAPCRFQRFFMFGAGSGGRTHIVSRWKRDAIPLGDTRMCDYLTRYLVRCQALVKGIEPPTQFLGGTVPSFGTSKIWRRYPHGLASVRSAEMPPYRPVHATGIEPVLLLRVMEALSHLAQRARCLVWSAASTGLEPALTPGFPLLREVLTSRSAH